jgi:hypothetical protein
MPGPNNEASDLIDFEISGVGTFTPAQEDELSEIEKKLDELKQAFEDLKSDGNTNPGTQAILQ